MYTTVGYKCEGRNTSESLPRLQNSVTNLQRGRAKFTENCSSRLKNFIRFDAVIKGQVTHNLLNRSSKSIEKLKPTDYSGSSLNMQIEASQPVVHRQGPFCFLLLFLVRLFFLSSSLSSLVWNNIGIAKHVKNLFSTLCPMGCAVDLKFSNHTDEAVIEFRARIKRLQLGKTPFIELKCFKNYQLLYLCHRRYFISTPFFSSSRFNFFLFFSSFFPLLSFRQ